MNGRFLVTMAAAAMALSGCGSAESDYEDEEYSEEESADEGLTAMDGERSDETYDEYDERRDGYEGENGTFMGDGCTVDCGGHEAGYEWASDNGITDPDQCGGNSWSFIEGCQSYAEEQQ